MSLGRLLAAGAAATVMLARPEPAVPWPGGRAPTALDLRQVVDGAARRERQDRALEIASAIENEQEALLFGVAERRLAQGFGLAEMFDYGLRAFRAPVRADFGGGGADGTSAVRRVQRGRQGRRDATSCDGCHSLGGRDGGGTAAQSSLTEGDGEHLSSARVRNPPQLLGVGLVAALAAEMTVELQATEARARHEATSRPVTLRLEAKGVSFGTITARPDGSVDRSAVEGVDADLVVRPLGWKGTEASVRRFAEEAARVHLGLQSLMVEARAASDPERYGAGPPWDPDEDGILREFDDGSLTAMAIYLELLEVPQVIPPADPELRARWARGGATFEAIGCATCHVPTLYLRERLHTERSDTDPSVSITVNLLGDGERPKGDDRVNLLSDLKRHDLGPDLADVRGDPGIGASTWLTRPLWGLADSGPWLHDGRAATVEDAIAAHGGEASASALAWVAMDPAGRADLQVWLMSLSRAPTVRAAR